jgi:predicted amidophosphoribosyltransferase
LEERIRNAETTFIISEKRKFKHVLLIDDETNSGATFNQIAGKLKSRGIAESVTGFAITGQQKGFEATTEMKVVA